MAIIKGSTGDWEYVIGLEIHSQVTSNTKLFSSSKSSYGAEPNSQVSLVDAAMPGMLPILNEFCVEQAVKTGLGLKAQINKRSVFDRKNYFYADLPQGYQITQFYFPIVTGGHINILDEKGCEKKIRIHHIHLEQDAGKSIHDQSPKYSFIDLNRSGVALMEIVTEPDMRSPHEAAEFVKKLRILLRYLGTCDGDMEKGSLRCDANVSVRKPGGALGTRCEIKNVNSVRNIVRAIEYEAMRQVELLESGGQVIQQTRLFDAANGTTRSMRSKEDSNDYRYFPDPDLLPLVITEEFITNIRNNLPELPEDKYSRYLNEFSLSPYDAEILTENKDVADYFEEVVSLSKNAKLSANWVCSELFAYLNNSSLEIAECKISPKMLAELIKLIEDSIISGKIAKQVFEFMTQTFEFPAEIVKKHNLVQVTDQGQIQEIINQVLDENLDSLNQYLSGKDKLFGFFVGQVMKKSQGKANPNAVNEMLIAAIESRK